MNDLPDSQPKTNKIWIALIALLALVALIVIINPLGSADDVAPDTASDEITVTTDELAEIEVADPDANANVNGAGAAADGADTVTGPDLPDNVDDVDVVEAPDTETAEQ